METRAPTHPSADKLRGFGIGQLENSDAVAVMSHLDSCQQCQKAVAAVTSDYFLDRLREARSRSGTPLPGKSLSELARSLYGTMPPSTSASSVSGLPPELANHPQYEVVSELGRGGMGVVYLARHRLSGRHEVLKVMNKELMVRSGSKERFLREIQSAAMLDHPNVVKMYTATELGDLMVLVMEYVQGQDLAKLVKAKGRLPVPNACFYAQQTALGLQHAFDKKMVHRDIKPLNLMLAKEGKKHIVKVLDFGLAKVARETGEQFELTGSGQMLGTPDYVAPEQTLDATNADIRADIYSLGCTLYYLLTGHAPFKGKSLFEILQAHQSMEAKPLNLERPEVPEEVAAIIAKMMAKDPAQRFQQPKEVALALAPFFRADAKASPSKPYQDSPEREAAALAQEVKETKAGKSIVPLAEITKDVKFDRSRQQNDASSSWETLTRSNIPSGKTGNRKNLLRRSAKDSQAARRKMLIGGGLMIGVLLMGLIGLWASGVLRQERLAEAASDDGFVLLFNGKDLTGWAVDSGDENAWQVKDGHLGAIGDEEDGRVVMNQGYLLTEREYSDFVLRFQFQQFSAQHAWGGVALRAVPHETAQNADPTRRPEFAPPLHLTVIVGQPNPLVGPWVTGSLWWQTGANPCLPPDNLGDLKKAGNWNDMEVEMRGQSLRIAVNGRDVQNVMLNKTRPDKNPLPGLSRFSGRVGFLKRAGEVRYRRIEIKELSADKDLSKKNDAPSVAGTWDATFFDGTKARSIFVESDHTITSDNGFRGRWEQTGRKVIVIDTNARPGIPATWEGEVDSSDETMTLTNGLGNSVTSVRRR